MRLKIIFIFILLSIFGHSFAQNVTPVQIERSQELMQQEEALRQRVEEPQKVFVKEVILPQDCLIPGEEVKKITGNFAGRWHSSKEIQEISDALAKEYQKAHHNGKLPQVTYLIKAGKLFFSFE